MDQGNFATRIQRVRGQLQSRAHLVALDARSAWDHANLVGVRDELAQLRDEARVQAHLGAMDARDAWARVESELQAFADKTGAAADHAVAEMTRALGEISDALARPSGKAEH